jgi:hypothetical protein
MYYFMYYLYWFACIACFWSLPLVANDFENLQELDDQDFKPQVGDQGKWHLTMLIIYAFSH